MDNIAAARAAIEAMHTAEQAAEKAREKRDTAVVAAHYKDGMKAPAIARALDMSVSNVRLILDRHRMVAQRSA